jgi:hypothetical protein
MSTGRKWTAEEEALLGTDTDEAIASQLQRTKFAVGFRRWRLRIPRFALSVPRRSSRWGATELAMLGRYPDDEVATITGRSLEEIQAKRLELESLDR